MPVPPSSWPHKNSRGWRKLHDKGVVSISTLDQTRTRQRLLHIEVGQAKEILRDSQILAPYDGIVLERFKQNHSAIIAGDVVARLTRSGHRRVGH